jgi:tetratricopeptide (TPR) repeat protein
MLRFASTVRPVCCAILVLLWVGCDWISPESKKTKHRERAASYFEKGQYSEALIEYKNVAQMEPNDADAHYRLALTYLKLGGLSNLQAAVAEFHKTLELDKTNQDAIIKLGELYLLGNEPKKAREQADIVLVSTPQSTEGLVLRGRSLVNEQRYQEGIGELKKAIELDPKNMRIYIELARAYVFSKDPASADAVLKQALRIEPRSIDILVTLGDLRASTGKPEDAEAIYTQALTAAPESDSLYLKLASFYQHRNKLAEAESTLQKLALHNPQDEKPHIHLGDFYSWTGQPDKALASYQRATDMNPDSQIARDKLIGYYLDHGKIPEAEIRIKAVLEKSQRDLMGRFFDARIRLARKNLDDAISILQGVVKDEPQFAGAHYFLGVAFLQKHQPTQARSAFAEAVKVNPNFPEARTALAEIYLAEGSTDLALEQAQIAVQLNPRNIPAAIISGDAYLRKGDLTKSRQIFEAVAQALPKEPIGPYRLGLVARAENNDSKAIAYFEEALAKKPSAIEPITQIAMIHMAQGKASEARDRVSRQLETVPNSPFLYDLLGTLWVKAKDLGQAEQAFKRAIELDNSLLSAYLNLAQTYYQAGKIGQAIKEYESVLAKEPQSTQALMMLGVIHESKQEHDKARARYEEILKFNAQFAPAANNLAWILVEHGGNLDVALAHAQTARERRPDDPYVADTIGWIYYKKHAYLLAVSLLREAAERLSHEPLVQYHFGMALYKSGDHASAKKALHTALKLNPNFTGSDEARKTLAGY